MAARAQVAGKTFPQLEQVSSASLTDAMWRIYPHRAHILDLATPTHGRILFGQAVTINFLPVRQDIYDKTRHKFARLFYDAIGEQGTGRVLVMASNGHPECSMAGGLKLSRLQNHRLAGLLCDGRLRDFDELRQYDIAVYCKGQAVRWGGDVLMPFAANTPVVIDKVTVMPGDYIYADEAAAVVIPEAGIEDVLNEARSVEAADRDYLVQIRNEKPADIRTYGSPEEQE